MHESLSVDFNASNQSSFQQLKWTIEMHEGQFVLILARCNYLKLRSLLVKQLHDQSPVKIREIHLDKSVKTLYTTVVNTLTQEQPSAVMVLDLELVNNLEAVLTSTNQVREEFRKNFAFPLVLWVNDQILQHLIRLVPDFKSWARTINFSLATEELIDFLRQSIDTLFFQVLESGAGEFLPNETILGSSNHLELDSTLKDLQVRGERLAPDIEAGVKLLLGRDAYTRGNIEQALVYYQASLEIFQLWGKTTGEQREQGEFLVGSKRAVVLFHLGLCYLHRADIQHLDQHLQTATDYFQQCLDIFEQLQRPDLVAKFINQLGEVLEQLSAWNELQALAQKSLILHQTYGTKVSLAQDYGFLAVVALAQSHWKEANQAAQKALQILAEDPGTDRTQSILYYLLLAQAQQQLNQLSSAIEYLEIAVSKGKPQYNPQLYIRILELLRSLYYQQGEYLKAFKIKQKQRSLEQQYGFLAFIGAGRLKPQQQFVGSKHALYLKASANNQEHIALEIEASGRQEDLKRLIDRITRDDFKLTVIHGPSGVGKSSLLQAGLVPALKQRTIATRQVLPLLLRLYNNWATDLGQVFNTELADITDIPTSDLYNQALLLAELDKNQSRNLLTVLIFDQFEEFFFVYTEPRHRKQFFEFLSTCLNIPFVKVILSMREDYLHYLLECNRQQNLGVINQDILSKHVLYYIGNFSRADAKNVIESLTARTHFHLEAALIEHLVQELAADLGEVRPIELQLVGAQLQTDKITTLEEYRQQGTIEKLVMRYLEAVIQDCGSENERAARSALYLLTDEHNTRPLKTKIELTRYLATEADKLDLVLEVFVKSGLVFMLPVAPENQYQLVHDYLVKLIRQQKGSELIAELEAERQERIRAQAKLNSFLKYLLSGAGVVILGLTYIGFRLFKDEVNASLQAEALTAQKIFTVRELDGLVESLKVGQKLQQQEYFNLVEPEIRMQVVSTLQEAVYSVKERNQLEGHSQGVNSVVFSPNGQTIASASNDSTVKIWSRQGKKLRTLQGHNQRVNSVVFSPDGRIIATASSDNNVKLWNLQGKELLTLQGHSNWVMSVAFSPDGQRIATASKDKTVKLWNLQGQELLTLQGHRKDLTSIVFSPDGKTIATASKDKTVKLWNLQGKELLTLTGHKKIITSVIFSPKGQMIATASGDKTVKLWKLQGKELLPLIGHSQRVESVVFSPDGQMLATASFDNTVKLWNLKGKELLTLQDHSKGVNSVTFSPDGQIIATASGDKTVKLWNWEGEKLQILKGHNQEVNSVVFSPDGQTVATASRDKSVKLWNLEGQELQTLQGHRGGISDRGGVTPVAFSPNGQTIAITSLDNTVKLWSRQGKKLKTLQGHNREVNSVAFSPDGKTIATASNDRTVKLWNLKGEQLHTLKGHGNLVISVAFSPNGKTIATASFDDTVKLWNLQGKELNTLEGHRAGVYSVVFSPDGKTIASASGDNTVKLWNLEGKELETFEGHRSRVYSVAFSPNGQMIATASGDKTVKLWNLRGEELYNLKGHSSVVNSVVFSPDGKTIATASNDNTAILWNLDLEDLIVRGCNWLDDYFITHPEKLAELTVCKKNQDISGKTKPEELE
ncbi:MAG: hypothetical protein F6K58_25750 [Symploca sp. SIO2E9]|nr:hypothetical protein [Symploca sp. SIO2E9]